MPWQAPLLERPRTRFAIESWDVRYGSSLEIEELPEARLTVTPDIETPSDAWSPVDPDPAVVLPSAMLFVDGVRRVDARVWFDDDDPAADMDIVTSAGICGSYAAGVVCCCSGRAHVVATEVRRGVFAVTTAVTDIVTDAGVYRARHMTRKDGTPVAVTLSSALQREMSDTEIAAATAARSGATDHPAAEDDLLVVDGPLEGRTSIDRIVGYIKSQHSRYLPVELNAMVRWLAPGQRTPVFLIDTGWDRYSWYLRLPSPHGSPWAGMVRLEASSLLDPSAVITLAKVTQRVLGRYASDAHKDPRAPQNLYPIAGLERHLRHRLGDRRIVYRALLAAARCQRPAM